MNTENNQEHPPTPNAQPHTPRSPTTEARTVAHERCTDCGATLVEDQRYCLQCGARRGLPRLDFTAFWKTASLSGSHAHEPAPSPTSTPAGGPAASPIGVHVGGSGTPRAGSARAGSTYGAWLEGTPSRRAAGILAAGVLAAGILAGAALGPTPPNSPADSSTLAERALAGLVASAGDSPTAAPAPAPTSTGASTPIAASTPVHKHEPASTASSKAGAPSSPEGPPPGESSTGTGSQGDSSEGSSSEGSSKGSEPAPGTPIKLPPIKHVWLISLSGASLVTAAGHTQTGPYLAKQLLPKGALLSGYTLTAPSSLANGIAVLSGQGVNLDTEQNCPTYSELQPPTVSATGLAEGVGCVYPAAVQTLADELTAAGLTWKAYVQGMEPSQTSSSVAGAAGSAEVSGTAATSATTAAPGAGSAPAAGTGTTPAAGVSSPASAASCRHPEPGAPDPDQAPSPGDPYQTFRDPFVYFHSLLDGGVCASNDVDFARLQSDLATPANTPNLSWIVPSACDDGSSAPCSTGAPAGLAPVDDFLKEVVPQILATASYREGGLIVIAPDSGPGPAGSTNAKPVGALLLSPFVHAGAHVTESLNDFSLLKSLSRLFGVLPLGHANDPSVASFGAAVYGSSGKAAKSASTAKKAAQAAPTTPAGG
jgi:phosphatidylinositol-3-phosphatase